MLDNRFSNEAFAADTDATRERLARELAEALARRVQGSSLPAQTAHECIEELKRLGHDLWSFDESDDFQQWCGDWTAPRATYELSVGFTYREQQPPTVTVDFRPFGTVPRK